MLPASSNPGAAYRAIYLVVCYENPTLPEVAVSIHANDLDLVQKIKTMRFKI
jgi:hypothetical protein